MKKYLTVLLTFVLVLGLCACTNRDPDQQKSENPPSSFDVPSGDDTVAGNVLIVDSDDNESSNNPGNPEDAESSDTEQTDIEQSGNDEVEQPSRAVFTDEDKSNAKAFAVELMKSEFQQQTTQVYDLKVTDLYNCVVTAGYLVIDGEQETLFLTDYDLHYDNGQWVKTAAYNRGSFNTGLYDIGYDNSGALVISPKVQQGANS